MAPRAFWTGHLRLSLVNIPVKLYPPPLGVERRIEFHQIHKPTGKRVRYQKVVPGVGPVENEAITKGYEYEKGKYVLVDPAEIDDLKLEAKQTIELVRFVGEEAIDDRYFETPTTCSTTATWRTRVIPSSRSAEGHRQDRRRPVHPARARQHRCDQAVRQGPPARSAAPRQRNCASDPLFKEITEVKADKEALDLAKELISRSGRPATPSRKP